MSNELATTQAAGLFRNVPFAEYLAWPELSQSVAKRGRESMRHLQHAWTDPGAKVVTDAMRRGKALNTFCLEPETAPMTVAVYESRRQGKEWESFRDANSSKTILTRDDYDMTCGAAKAFRDDPEVRKLLAISDGVEVSARSSWLGIPVKARCDILLPDIVYDLKAVSGEDRMGRSMYKFEKYGYPFQGAFYSRVFARKRFALITVEIEPPHCVQIIEFGDKVLDRAHDEIETILEKVSLCQQSGIWPGPQAMVMNGELPDNGGYEGFIQRERTKRNGTQ